MDSSRPLDILVEDVAREGRALTNFLASNSYYQPSFLPGGFKDYPELPEDIRQSRVRLREAAKAVYDLASGPTEYVKSLSDSYSDSSCLQWLLTFHIPEAIPLVGSITYSQIAASCDVDEVLLRRFLRYAMTNRLFYELSPDEVAHTTYSSILVTDHLARDYIESQSVEAFPCSAKLVDACEKWGASEEPNRCAFSLSNRTDRSYFDYLEQPGHEDDAKRFENYMHSINSTPELSLQHIVDGYDWKNTKGTIVDIGGGNGGLAIALARGHRDLPQIIVEDSPKLAAEGEESVPSDLRKQVFFLGHNFFEDQPENVLEAKLFIMRMILHDYSDKYAGKILTTILPALKKGATLLVVDAVLPQSGSVPPQVEKALRGLDLEMMIFGGKERSLEDWEALFKSVDSNLILRNVNKPSGSLLSILEVVCDS